MFEQRISRNCIEVMIINNISIKNNIQKFRNLKNLNQDELAAAIGVTRTYLSKLENQKFSPGPGLMQKVCNYFIVGLGDIFYIENEN